MTIRAVLFDLDHTLFDHEAAARAGLSALAASLGITVTDAVDELWFRIEDEQYERYMSGKVDLLTQRRTRFRLFADRPDATDDEADDAWAVYYAAYVAAWRAFDDAIETLLSLRSKGLKIGIITNGHHAQQVLKTERSGLAPLLDDVVSSGDTGIAKPDKRIFELACKRLRVSPAEALFVGDNYAVDVEGALGAGLSALHINREGAVSLTHPEGTITRADQVLDWVNRWG